MARKRSRARSAPQAPEAETVTRLPPFGAEFSLGPATRSYRSPMVGAVGSAMVVPSVGYDTDEMDEAAEMGGEAVDQPEADALDESADEADGAEVDLGSEEETDGGDAEANGEEGESDDEDSSS